MKIICETQAAFSFALIDGMDIYNQQIKFSFSTEFLVTFQVKYISFEALFSLLSLCYF
jgi:hypothetical protein